MNEAAANALYDAERRGVTQHFPRLPVFVEGRLCAVQVIEQAGVQAEWKMGPQLCPACGTRCHSEVQVAWHLNDDHGFTFSEIARKLGPDGA